MNDLNLADEFIKFVKTATPDTTINDFFEHCGVPMEDRTDFYFAAIIKQVQKKTKKAVLIY